VYTSFIKRLIDILVSAIFLFLALPIVILVIILIKMTSKGSILFKQKRAGLKGKIFVAFKFRTMYDRPREVKKVLKGDPDVTKIGSYLRRLKIDEFPQLLNVLFGDMSLVGPRPAMIELENEFNEDGKFRLLVKPGLTGLAQVNGNIHLSWQERWKYDRYYVENIDFFLDLKILFKTIAIIIRGEDKYIKRLS